VGISVWTGNYLVMWIMNNHNLFGRKIIYVLSVYNPLLWEHWLIYIAFSSTYKYNDTRKGNTKCSMFSRYAAIIIIEMIVRQDKFKIRYSSFTFLFNCNYMYNVFVVFILCLFSNSNRLPLFWFFFYTGTQVWNTMTV
jgi:hypothetical protein